MASIYVEIHGFFADDQGQSKQLADKVVLDHQEYRSKFDFRGFHKRDPDFVDTGYLLIARYSKKHGQAIVELFSIAEEQVLHTWAPPRKELFDKTRNLKFRDGDPLTPERYRVVHPLLLDDGSLIFKTAPPGPMARIDSCGDIEWINNHFFHHSSELDHNGNIVTPTVKKGNGSTKIPIRDDGFAIVTVDGEIVEEFSITDILLQNGYRGIVYGIGDFERDRIHLNDAQPVLYQTADAEVGDILLSMRHLSTVALFSPAQNKIKWLKTGPWLNQHDINQLGENSYTIYGNDVVRKGNLTGTLLRDNISEVYVYTPQADTVTTPYSNIIAQQKIGSETEGRARVLANGDVFIEQSNYSRLLRVAHDKVRWEYVNGLSPNTVGTLNWSRYLTKKEVNLNWLEKTSCSSY